MHTWCFDVQIIHINTYIQCYTCIQMHAHLHTMCICTYIHAYIYINISILRNTYRYTVGGTYRSTQAYYIRIKRTQTHKHIQTHTNTHTYAQLHMHRSTCIIYIYMYVYIIWIWDTDIKSGRYRSEQWGSNEGWEWPDGVLSVQELSNSIRYRGIAIGNLKTV